MVVEGVGAWDGGGVGDDVDARVEGERVGGNYLATVNNRLWVNTWADILADTNVKVDPSNHSFLLSSNFTNFRIFSTRVVLRWIRSRRNESFLLLSSFFEQILEIQ